MRHVKSTFLLSLAIILVGLVSPKEISAAVLGIKGYSAPSGGQDRFAFDVYVSSQSDNPDCTITANYKDGTASYSTRGMAPFSTNIVPNQAATITINCEGLTASTAFAGNSYPFAGDVNQKVGNFPGTGTPSPLATPKPTIAPPSPTVTSSPAPQSSQVPVSSSQAMPMWVKNISFSPLRNFIEFILRIFGKR